MPPNTKHVGRPSYWGNYHFDEKIKSLDDRVWIEDYGEVTVREAFNIMVREWQDVTNFSEWIEPLRGKNLACWCLLDRPCHADLLLEIANGE